MGISTIQSYQGSQIFEAVGISKEVIDKYFTNTVSRVGGITIDDIQKDMEDRHQQAFDPLGLDIYMDLPSVGAHKFRSGSAAEQHLYNPQTIHLLQQAVWTGDYGKFKQYTAAAANEGGDDMHLRSLLEFNYPETGVPIEEVEDVDSIVKRFKTAAMSYGALSKEAHDRLAIAMNRLGGKSNTGEGGEDEERYGTERNSAIKQVASARFGVTSKYLVSAKEIQIKMAQGAKPGEGGQLPGGKVYPWVAKCRHSTTGVGLISPPPHHDIYSIEDLAQLIYDLKCANRSAAINVKLVSEAGVGTIAAGVAKAGAEVILISGFDGGTGAASINSSIHNAGLPWELGIAEAHQCLIMNGLRSRVRIESDSKLMSGRDVAIAAMLGAEEFGYGLRNDAGVQSGHLPHGHLHPEPRAEKEVHGQARVRDELHEVHGAGAAGIYGEAGRAHGGRTGRSHGLAESSSRPRRFPRQRNGLVGIAEKPAGGEHQRPL